MWRLRVLLVSTLSCVLPAPATAMDLSQATARLSSIDKGLASCLTPLVSSHAIPPDAVRACIAAARPKDHDLRRDLNGWIPLLAESDPDREAALLIRQTLNMLRTFMNHLDRALLYRQAALDPGQLDRAVRAACRASRIGAADDPAAPDAAFFIGPLCD